MTVGDETNRLLGELSETVRLELALASDDPSTIPFVMSSLLQANATLMRVVVFQARVIDQLRRHVGIEESE